MDIEKLIEDLRGLLKQYGEKIPYGELVGAPWPYSRSGDLVWQDPEPYFIEQAATALSTLQAEKEKLMVRNTKLEDTIRSQRNGLQELRAELEQVTRERDAAIGDIYSGNANDCDTCLHGCDYNNDCPIETGGECKYKWRGLQREN